MRRQRPRQSEASLQRQIRELLTALGYTVMETGKGRSRVTCATCGARSYATGWQGNTPGLPDLYIHRREWANPVAVALELKAEGGRPTTTQAVLNDMGMTRIVRSASEALDALATIEMQWGYSLQTARIMAVMTANNWRTDEHFDTRS